MLKAIKKSHLGLFYYPLLYLFEKPTLRNYQGFSLVELMIVLAIIGILAAIALPSYVDYMGRSQATEGFAISDSIRQEIALWVWEHNAFPDAIAVSPTGSLGKQTAKLQGKYIDSNGVTITPNTGGINVRFSRGVLANQTMTLTPTINNLNNAHLIEWRCGGQINLKYLSSTCK